MLPEARGTGAGMAGLNVWPARLSPAAKRSAVQTRITTLYEWGGPPGLPYPKFYILGPRLRIDVHLVSSYQARACTIPSPVRALNMATLLFAPTTACLRARLRTAPIRSRERQRADAQLLMTFCFEEALRSLLLAARGR